MRNKLLIITGATAAGKSAFVYRELRSLPLTVINADSRQFYKDIAIASASPSPAEKSLFEHRLFNFLEIDASFSAGAFVQAARTEIANSHAEGRLPVIVGGSYFYIHALLGGLLPEISISDNIRADVQGLDAPAAYAELKNLDARAAEQIHPHNAVRVKRALMLCRALGGKISTLERVGGIADAYDTLLLIFDMPRDALRERIAMRIAAMENFGLFQEMHGLLTTLHGRPIEKQLDWRALPALSGIGVREFFESYAETGVYPQDLDTAAKSALLAKIAQNTRRLVKKQQTWFKNAKPLLEHTKTVDPSYENARIAELVMKFAGTTL